MCVCVCVREREREKERDVSYMRQAGSSVQQSCVRTADFCSRGGGKKVMKIVLAVSTFIIRSTDYSTILFLRTQLQIVGRQKRAVSPIGPWTCPSFSFCANAKNGLSSLLLFISEVVFSFHCKVFAFVRLKSSDEVSGGCEITSSRQENVISLCLHD